MSKSQKHMAHGIGWHSEQMLYAIVHIRLTARVSLAEVFPPWMRWKGLHLDWRVRPAAPAPTPAAFGNLGFCPLGIEVEKQSFRMVWLIIGQKFQGVGLKLTTLILSFRDPSSHLCQKYESC